MSSLHSSPSNQSVEERIARLEALVLEQARVQEQLRQENAELRLKLQKAEEDNQRLRLAYTGALEQLELMRRRLFAAKAERLEVAGDQLSLVGLFPDHSAGVTGSVEQNLGTGTLLQDDSDSIEGDESPAPGGRKKPKKSDKPPSGRRNLEDSTLLVLRVEVTDPALEGKYERIGFEESWKLAYEPGGMRRVQIAKAVYKIPGEIPDADTSDAITTPRAAARFVTAPNPKELFRRSLLAPSLIAHFLVLKYAQGVPFARQESLMALQGASVDRGTMCRYAEDAGASLAPIVDAAKEEAMATAFCLSTDATGVAIQPTPLDDGKRQPCRKGHFFVILADRDHVFFEFQPKHTSRAVCEMFRGYRGYIQADAHGVYNALFEGRPVAPLFEETHTSPPPIEVGCWAHTRRNYWEAAVCKHPEGLIGLKQISAIYEADGRLDKLPPEERKRKRLELVRPLVEAFFAWVDAELGRSHPRGLVSKALGYSCNQRAALCTFLEDGRLKLDNNSAERGIRPICTGRKNWLFLGSDDHAEAAATLFSLVASCKLHNLDPERYLTEVMRVMPYWPRKRYLELSPRYWARSRATLNTRELDAQIGHISVPPLATQ